MPKCPPGRPCCAAMRTATALRWPCDCLLVGSSGLLRAQGREGAHGCACAVPFTAPRHGFAWLLVPHRGLMPPPCSTLDCTDVYRVRRQEPNKGINQTTRLRYPRSATSTGIRAWSAAPSMRASYYEYEGGHAMLAGEPPLADIMTATGPNDARPLPVGLPCSAGADVIPRRRLRLPENQQTTMRRPGAR